VKFSIYYFDELVKDHMFDPPSFHLTHVFSLDGLFEPQLFLGLDNVPFMQQELLILIVVDLKVIFL
jgi:hypothetical protein